MIKRRSLWGILLVAAILLTGCSVHKSTAGTQDQKEDKIQIGFCFDSFIIERWQRDRDVFVSTAQSLGAEVNVQNANGDLEEQISQIKYLIDSKVDVIVVIAIDSEACTDVLKKAREEGIAVIVYDRLVCDANANLYISYDNVEVGELMGRTISKNLPEGGKIVTIYGPTTDHNVQLVQEGFEDYIKNKNYDVVYSVYADQWIAETAFDAVNEALKLDPKIDAVLCGNDNLASQAVRALSENRLAGKVIVTGQDADLAACQRIVEGTQTMTVYKPVDTLAQTAAKYAVKLAKGETIDTDNTINDGSYDIPYVKLEPIAVTKDNIDNVIIGGGFQQKEDVYLNVPELMDK